MQFAYLVRPAFDQEFLARATQHERDVVQAHSDWLEARFAEGRVVFAGRCYDGPFGLVILEAGSEGDARRLMEQDPAVRTGVQRTEFHPFRTFLARGTDHGGDNGDADGGSLPA